MDIEAFMGHFAQFSEIDPGHADAGEWDDYIEGGFRTSWRNNLLEFRADLKPKGDATAILTWGLSVATNSPSAGHVEGRAYGYNDGIGISAATGLWLPLSAGRHKGAYATMATVRIRDNNWVLVSHTARFDFEVA